MVQRRTRSTRPQGLPTKKQVIEFIQSSDIPAGKREIARAFEAGNGALAVQNMQAELRSIN